MAYRCSYADRKAFVSILHKIANSKEPSIFDPSGIYLRFNSNPSIRLVDLVVGCLLRAVRAGGDFGQDAVSIDPNPQKIWDAVQDVARGKLKEALQIAISS